jgi:putative transposase
VASFFVVTGFVMETWSDGRPTRWRRVPRDRRRGPTTAPPHTLTVTETSQILSVANQPEFRNLSPERVIAKLADKGTYICSERSLRRVLKREKRATYRQRSRPGIRRHKPREFVACKPRRILTWDITYLKDATVRGHFFFLHLFMDIWSRRIVGWEVHATQSSELAAQLLQRLCIAEGVETPKCVLHSDNGAPMKGSTMLATMHDLGITKSFSRPQVSDDNAHVESLFRHLKYAPSYPTRGFDDLVAARTWVGQFVAWYNSQHLHSGIGCGTPDDQLCANRGDNYLDEYRLCSATFARPPLLGHLCSATFARPPLLDPVVKGRSDAAPQR